MHKTSGFFNYMSANSQSSLFKNGKVLTRRDISGSDAESVGIELEKYKMDVVNARNYINNKSILYGSPAQALLITMCIKPCAERGCSQLKALSILVGFPSLSISRSLGDVGKPSGIPSNGLFALESFPAGFGPGTTCFGKGGLYLKPPGVSIDPKKI